MFLVKLNENLIAKANRYYLADSVVDGSVRFSIFSNSGYFYKG